MFGKVKTLTITVITESLLREISSSGKRVLTCDADASSQNVAPLSQEDERDLPQYTTTFEEEERSSLAETPAREAMPIDRASNFLRKDMILI